MELVLGMSGGVDSAAAASLLMQNGHKVHGVTLYMTDAAPPDIEGAKATADLLHIPHTVIDCRADFRREVEDYFASAYRMGETPNPCVICNRTVKLARLLAYAKEIGAEGIATGHYAKIGTAPDGSHILQRAADLQKDQSYMLYRITKEQLDALHLPLGDHTKAEIRTFAADAHLMPRIPRDSMDICFVPHGDYGRYLLEQHGMEPVSGDFLDAEGKQLGQHGGQWLYTVGQRKGLGIACGHPVYVLAKDAAANTVTVGEEAALFARGCTLRQCNLLCEVPETLKATAKIRYSRTEAPVTAIFHADGTAHLTFDIPQRAMTCGQSAVVYVGDTVVGGGIIDTVTGGACCE